MASSRTPGAPLASNPATVRKAEADKAANRTSQSGSIPMTNCPASELTISPSGG